MTASKRAAAAAEVSGEKSAAENNGSTPTVGTFAVWRSLSTAWKGPNTVKSTFRRHTGAGYSITTGVGLRYYLLSPEDGEAVLGKIDGSFADIKEPVARQVDATEGSIELHIAGFRLSRANGDGTKTVSLVLDGDDALGRLEEERQEILRSAGAEDLVLPGLEPVLEIGKVTDGNKRGDVRPVMDRHMPKGMRLSLTNPVLMYRRPPQP